VGATVNPAGVDLAEMCATGDLVVQVLSVKDASHSDERQVFAVLGEMGQNFVGSLFNGLP